MQTAHPISLPVQRIVLTGFMGSGKTTVGRALAQRLQWSFFDLDEAVQQRQGLPVPEIFAQRGEAIFREAETQALRELLVQSQAVIALGGGAPETANLRCVLREADTTVVFHLHAPFEVLYKRCIQQTKQPGATERPLLGSRAEAEDRYTRRLSLYKGVAHHEADGSATSPSDVVDEILLRLLPTPVTA